MTALRKSLIVTSMGLAAAVGIVAVGPVQQASAASVTIGGNQNITVSANWLLCDGTGGVTWGMPVIFNDAIYSQNIYANSFISVWNGSAWQTSWVNRSDGSRLLTKYNGILARWYDVKTGSAVTSISARSPRHYVGGGHRVYWTDASGISRYTDVWDYVPVGLNFAGQTYCYTGG